MRPPDAVRQFLEQEQIHNQPVACALSGGADSICLLFCLLKWQKKYQLAVSAVHVQHHLRGQESIRDENFCSDFCRKFHVPSKSSPWMCRLTGRNIPAVRSKLLPENAVIRLSGNMQKDLSQLPILLPITLKPSSSGSHGAQA